MPWPQRVVVVAGTDGTFSSAQVYFAAWQLHNIGEGNAFVTKKISDIRPDDHVYCKNTYREAQEYKEYGKEWTTLDQAWGIWDGVTDHRAIEALIKSITLSLNERKIAVITCPLTGYIVESRPTPLKQKELIKMGFIGHYNIYDHTTVFQPFPCYRWAFGGKSKFSWDNICFIETLRLSVYEEVHRAGGATPYLPKWVLDTFFPRKNRLFTH